MTQVQSVKVTRTITYSPDSYYEYCEEYNEEPTQDGFLNYIEDWINEDFENQHGEQTVELI